MYVCSSVTDIVLDMSILCLPIAFIRKLHMSSGQKIGTSSIFGLGILLVPQTLVLKGFRLTFWR